VIVLDSSAAVDYLLGREPEAEWVRQQLHDARWRIRVPHLFDVEVVGVLRRHVLAHELRAGDAHARVRLLAELPARRYPHVQLLGRAWELHPTVNTPDACFVALAEALNVPLVTTDRRLARARGPRIPILAP
jgi:predicted nucleic acid-binding protein